MSPPPDMTVAPPEWHNRTAAPAEEEAIRGGKPLPSSQILRVAVAQMLCAMCPLANKAGIVDVLRDVYTDSILLGVILVARLVAACDRIVQLTPLAPRELSANMLICVVIAEKLLSDAPFDDLLGMIAAALDLDKKVAAQLEFRVLSILSVHEHTIVLAEEHTFLTKTVASTDWGHLAPEDCLAMLRDYMQRSAVARAHGWRKKPAHTEGREGGLTGELLAYQQSRSLLTRRSSSSLSSISPLVSAAPSPRPTDSFSLRPTRPFSAASRPIWPVGMRADPSTPASATGRWSSRILFSLTRASPFRSRKMDGRSGAEDSSSVPLGEQTLSVGLPGSQSVGSGLTAVQGDLDGERSLGLIIRRWPAVVGLPLVY
ncbi:hypothetical protein T492DRAFT_1022567 [Pavlovales sp. CCMP2436]|nr:hypothetical protein T492DRAFT_1022567 [Pavlovales sp. CCMP2436]